MIENLLIKFPMEIVSTWTAVGILTSPMLRATHLEVFPMDKRYASIPVMPVTLQILEVRETSKEK